MINPITKYIRKVAEEHSVRILNLKSCRTEGFSAAPLISVAG